MHNMRTHPHALEGLIQFKRSTALLPCDDLIVLFTDFYRAGENPSIAVVFEDAYNFFYSQKKQDPGYPSFSAHMGEKCGVYGLHTLDVAVETPAHGEEAGEGEEKRTCTETYWVLNAEAVSRSSTLSPRTCELIARFRSSLRKKICSYHRFRYGAAVTVHVKPGMEAECTPVGTPKKQGPASSSLLVYLSAKKAPSPEEEEAASGPDFRNAAVRYGHMFWGKIDSMRRSEQLVQPVRMVFFKMHSQVRPPYHAKRQSRKNVQLRRDTTAKMQHVGDYGYDSDEEWIAEEGESIDSIESEEAEEEEEGELEEWIEPDKEEFTFSGRKLPTLDFPDCAYHPVQRGVEGGSG